MLGCVGVDGPSVLSAELKEERKLIQRDLGLEEAGYRPFPARRTSVDSGLQEGRRWAPKPPLHDGEHLN